MGSSQSTPEQQPAADVGDGVHLGTTSTSISGPDNSMHIFELHPETAFGTLGTLALIAAAAYGIHRCQRAYRRRQERDILRRHRLPRHPPAWGEHRVTFDGPRFQEVDDNGEPEYAESQYEASRPVPSRLQA